MSKYMTVEGITFKKTDLKRIERVPNTPRAYVFIAGRKSEIAVSRGDMKMFNIAIHLIMTEAEEK